jgi:transposase
MIRLTKKQKWFKQQNLTQKDKIYVGLDVHKKSISVAIWLNGQIELTFNASADYARLIKQLRPIQKAIKLAVYEAGPTGYGLARTMKKAKIPVQVISPANTPRPSKHRSKTDRLDCCELAEFAAKGLLKPVTIPTEQEEADRQLQRLRDQLVSKRRRVRQQIKSFLLQHSIAEPDGLQGWSLAAIDVLQTLPLNIALRFTLDMYLEEMAQIRIYLERTEAALQALSEHPRHRRAMKILRSHPGIGPVTAWAFRLEIFRPDRFEQGTEVAGFLGLAPRIRQSGQTTREGPIIKTGRPQLRSKLIEASWVWIRYDAQARKVYNRLCSNTGNANKAIVAMARRLAIRLWKMLCEGQLYRQTG